jgi:hypothetical protein
MMSPEWIEAYAETVVERGDHTDLKDQLLLGSSWHLPGERSAWQRLLPSVLTHLTSSSLG